MEFFQLEAFSTDLSEIVNEDITTNLYTTSVDNLHFESVLNKHAPLKELSRTEMKFRSKLWLTKRIRNSIMEYHRSIFVTLTKTTGVNDPVFKNKKIYFPSTKVYHKDYAENITLIEQFEH